VLQVSKRLGQNRIDGSTNRWITLEYSSYESLPAILPKNDSGVVIDDAQVPAWRHEKTSVLNLKICLRTATSPFATKTAILFPITGYIGTGCVVNMVVNGEVWTAKRFL
jgi:L-asparaginase/Glu-tRNA(Gln) amidotransferase subunit D